MNVLEDKLYTTSQAADLAKVSRWTLGTWIKRGFISATHGSKRQGHPARYTKSDIIRLTLFRLLSECGCSLALTSDIVNDPAVFSGFKAMDDYTVKILICPGVLVDVSLCDILDLIEK